MADQEPESGHQTEKPDYPELPPRPFSSLKPSQYISERINQALTFYDKSARRSKKLFLWMRAITVVGGAMVPVLVNLRPSDLLRLVTTLMSISVVLLISLESVFHFREQWVNYRPTEQYLRKEYFLFVSKEGPYGDMEGEKATGSLWSAWKEPSSLRTHRPFRS